jgi:hypothetical protein
MDLVTLAEYKAYAGISSSTQDAAINNVIPKVSALVKNLCRRTFVDYVSDAKIEVTSGNGSSKIYLKEYPVINLSSVEISYDYGQTYTELELYNQYVFDQEDDALYCTASETFPKYINGYKITYTGGYEILPEDLKVAVLDLVGYYLKNDMAIHSPKAPGTNSVQIEYVTSTNLPAHIKRVLDLYRGSYD